MLRGQRKGQQIVDYACWTPENLAWFTGLFEGEGHISLAGVHSQLSITIAMTDHDVLEHCIPATGTGSVTGPYQDTRGNNRRPIFHWKVSGLSAYALGAAIYRGLGARRKEQMLNALSGWVAYRPPPHWTTRTIAVDTLRLTHDGQTMTLRQWSVALGVPPSRLYSRLARGLSPAEILDPRTHQGRR